MPEVRDLTGQAWALTGVVTRLRRALRTAIRTDYAWERLPVAQVEVMQRLRERPGSRVTDLAAWHRLAPNTVSTLAHQLVAAGLVQRESDRDDRRAVRLRLTDAGGDVLGAWDAAHARRFDDALTALAPADRGRLAAALPALERLVEQLERSAPASAEEPDRGARPPA